MLDKIIVELDQILKTIIAKPTSRRPHPDAFLVEECELSVDERQHISALMRVNHCGEVCAQGLYSGQSLTSRDKINRQNLLNAALEETEHLAWTSKRIYELGGHTTQLNSFFYLTSFMLGFTVGLVGDKWNLGFLEETEKQVSKHLDRHIKQIPKHDKKTLAILHQMQLDETKHAEMAHNAGAAELPKIVKILMKFSSRIMTKITYYI